MDKKVRRSFLFNLAIVLSLCLVLYVSFFATLHWITRHGEELQIPGLTGKPLDNAITQLQSMHFEVYVDSTYEPSVKPLTVLKQVPDSGAIVKQGRTVFLTVNMLTPPYIPMPNLVSLSLRSAQMLLRNNKLMMGDTTHKADIAAGAVLEQHYRGMEIRPGEMIAQGSKINLVIGDGLGNTQFNVPDVAGMPVEQALISLAQYSIIPIIVANDRMSAITDTSSAIVVSQEPSAINEAGVPNRIKEGDFITLKIMQDPGENDVQGNNTTAPSDVNSDNKKKKPK